MQQSSSSSGRSVAARAAIADAEARAAAAKEEIATAKSSLEDAVSNVDESLFQLLTMIAQSGALSETGIAHLVKLMSARDDRVLEAVSSFDSWPVFMNVVRTVMLQDGVVDAAAYALSYVQQTAFWIYLFLASIPVMVLYDVFFVGLFVFEYEKNDIVLSSDSRILVDKANADAGVFDEDDKVAS